MPEKRSISKFVFFNLFYKNEENNSSISMFVVHRTLTFKF